MKRADKPRRYSPRCKVSLKVPSGYSATRSEIENLETFPFSVLQPMKPMTSFHSESRKPAKKDFTIDSDVKCPPDMSADTEGVTDEDNSSLKALNEKLLNEGFLERITGIA